MAMTIHRTNIIGTALAGAILLAGTGAATVAAAPCPPSIATPGTVLELTEDLACPVGEVCTCIAVRADDVIVRLNGHSVIGNGGNIFAPIGSPLRTSGVSLLESDNVIIEGPGEIVNFARGVAVTGSENVGIYGLEIRDNQRGIQLSGRTGGVPTPVPTRDVEVHDTKIKNSELQGVMLTGFTSGVRLDSVEIEDSGVSGILWTNSADHDPPTNTLVQRCEVKSSLVGVHLLGGATNTTVSECKIKDASVGIQVGLPNSGQAVADTRIRDSVVSGNNTGISVTSASQDTKVRRSCFEDNLGMNNILDNSFDGATLLDNRFDPAEGCD